MEALQFFKGIQQKPSVDVEPIHFPYTPVAYSPDYQWEYSTSTYQSPVKIPPADLSPKSQQGQLATSQDSEKSISTPQDWEKSISPPQDSEKSISTPQDSMEKDTQSKPTNSGKEMLDSSEDESSDSDDQTSQPRSPLKAQNIDASRKKKIKEKLPEKIYPITELFSPSFLEKRKKQSVSRPNFATILVRNFFKQEVRMTSNVNGRKGKNKLNVEMVGAIKVATYKMWPLKSTETDAVAWRACRKAIDSDGRQLVSRKLNRKEN